MPYKPHGYTSVSPYLIVADAAATLDFLEGAFGAPPLRVFHRDDGSIRHAEVRIDDTVVMFGQMEGGPQTHVHVYVPDVDGVFARALEAGGSLVEPVQDKGDGDRRGGVRAPDGTVWWIATQAD